MAFETFKILNDMSSPALSDLINLRENSTYNFRYYNILQVPQWNSFPDEFRKVNNFEQFKALTVNWNVGRGTANAIYVGSCSADLFAAMFVLCILICLFYCLY